MEEFGSEGGIIIFIIEGKKLTDGCTPYMKVTGKVDIFLTFQT